MPATVLITAIGEAWARGCGGMNFDLSDDQKMLKDQARKFLDARVSYDALRHAIDAGAETDLKLWRDIAELGWLAIAVPEEHGGLGLGILEQSVVVEELARCVAPVPFVSSAGLVAEAIAASDNELAKSTYLPLLASGERIGAFAFHEGPGAPDAGTMRRFATCEQSGLLTGRKWPVIDGRSADLFVVCAKDGGGIPALYLVEADAAGIERTPLSGFDQLRLGCVLDLSGTPAMALKGDAEALVASLFERGAVLAAFEQVGGAQACLDMARDYALERRAFGRAIGSYQAIKHKLADMLTRIELARSNAYYAAWASAYAAPDAALAAATARVSATEAYEFAARENMQVHGGISFTWEANCHFHYRRSRHLAMAHGSALHWSRQIVSHLAAA